MEPPGEARSDLDIWVDYGRRMGFTDSDGGPIPAWSQPEEAFAAWQKASAGRPCDYTGMSYEALSGGSGIQWPCTAEHPDGTERLYADAQFPNYTEYCETYGHDFATGAAITRDEHGAQRLDGRARLRGAPYLPPDEVPDAARLGLTEGDIVRVANDRGAVEAPLRVGYGRDGLVFAPFHYGNAAANELTQTVWDPVFKQPTYKEAAVGVTRVGDGRGPAPAPTNTASAPATTALVSTAGGPAADARSELTRAGGS